MRFLNDESGTVTVDWVVLSAAIIGLGIAVILSISPAAESVGDDISTAVENVNFE